MKSREEVIQNIKNVKKWDVLVIGGGASGLGVALDAVSRGLSCLLIEREDFGSGTSSKSTKLIHGGVRYLAQGYISLVSEALKERSYFLQFAPHISSVQKFIIPAYGWFEAIKYYFGLKIYDLLSMNKSLGGTKWISSKNLQNIFPSLNKSNLVGGIEYTDGKFDDSRMCIDLVNTISSQNGNCINYFSFENFIKEEEKIIGAKLINKLNGETFEVNATVTVNATGVYAEQILDKADKNSKIKIVPSQGSHVVTDKVITNSEYGLMIPKTSDGRVLFAIPWKNKLLVGTTDVAQKKLEDNPKPTAEEISFILQNLQAYCGKDISHNNIISTFAGLRPLAAPKEGKSKTKEISRSHKVVVSPSNLLSIIGGKWTTFRKMGEDTIQKAIDHGLINSRMSSSSTIKIKPAINFENHSFIHPDLPYSIGDFTNIIKNEMVESLDDLLSRRTRCTFISIIAAKSIAKVALDLIGEEKKWTKQMKQKEMEYFLGKWKG